MVKELARQSKGLGFESRLGMDVCVVCMFVCLSVFVCSEYTGAYVLDSPDGVSVRCRSKFRLVLAQVST